jgi:hypothetical protein
MPEDALGLLGDADMLDDSVESEDSEEAIV